MSRPRLLPTTGTSGADALPSPAGDPEWLRACADQIRRALHEARSTPTLRGHLAVVLPQVWVGLAADAAVLEAAELVRRCAETLDHLGVAATALDRYAGELERGQDSVRRLQREWDRLREQHARHVVVLRARVVLDPGAAPLLVRVDEEHESELVRLTRLHHQCEVEIAAATLRTTHALALLDDVSLPRGQVPDAATLRTRLSAGLPITAGAFASTEVAGRASSDAARLRVALATGDHHAIATALGSLQGDPTDVVYAQAVMTSLGIGAVEALVLELAQSSSGTDLDRARASVGILGTILLSSATPETDDVPPGGRGARDPRTERQVQSAAALLRDELVRSLGTVTTSSSGDWSATGAWLTGQLVVGARSAGWSRPLAPALVRRLTAGIASAELAETRDDDATRRMGTSLSAGGARFASLFDDADVTGDALHVVLRDAGTGEGESDVAALLLEPVDGHGVAGSRGGSLVLAEALVRRWVTYEAGATASHRDLELATNADLTRLLGAVAIAGSEPTASLRARVMTELGRTNAFAQQSFSTAMIYEANTAPLEAAAVDWVLDMPLAVDAMLQSHGSHVGTQWSQQIGSRHEPLLGIDELTSVLAAFTVGADLPRSAKTPDAPYRRLVDGELARARGGAPGPDAGASAALRLGFFEQAASAALVEIARRQDATNQSMWRTLAEAKALALSWKEGPVAFGQAVVTAAKGEPNRSAEDDLAIAVVRSDVELEQTIADESRSHGIASTLESMGVGGAFPSAAALFEAGARRGPALPSSTDLSLARRREQADAVTGVAQSRSDQRALKTASAKHSDPAQPHGSASPHASSAIPSSADASTHPLKSPGADRVAEPYPHEQATAERLRSKGHDVEILPRSDTAKSPDALIDGERWEFKAPVGSSPGTIIQSVRYAREQSSKIVVDLGRSPLALDEVLRQVDEAIHRYDRIDVVRVITVEGDIIERRP